MTTLLTGLTIVPVDGPDDAPTGTIRAGSIRIDGEAIAAIGDLEPREGEVRVDCTGLTAFPGFVQGHVHYCQTLFRGLADDLALLDWLQQRIWPLEAAHDADSTRASAELSVIALLRGGTTTAQVMESVRHAEQSFEVAARSGMTTILGNCWMDVDENAPPGFVTTTAEALAISEQLCDRFDRQGRLRYAVSPRFILSCTDALSRDAAAFAKDRDVRIHTHAGEHPDEVVAVRARAGTDYLLALDAQGLLGPRTGLAHCVHLNDAERDVLRSSGSAVLHCPSTNLKLGSGIAPIARYREVGIPVAIGVDGAPANNRLSALTELRQAALLQSQATAPGNWPADQALFTMTRGGARALGLEDELGSIEVGKRADLVLCDLETPDLHPGGPPVGRLVYSAADEHVRHVLVGGRFAVRDGAVCDFDAEAISARAAEERDALLTRAGLRA